MDDEHTNRTLHEKIFVSRNGLNGHHNGLETAIDQLMAAAHQGETAALIRLVRRLVPECAGTLGQCADPVDAPPLPSEAAP